MANKKTAKTPKPIVITGSEKTKTIDIVKIEEAWSTYTLSDGTELKVKPAILHVKRIENKFNLDGRPIYMVQSGVALDTVVPKRLIKKGK